MILALNHKNLVVYKYAGKLILECFKFTDTFPSSANFTLTPQIRRAAISVKLNIAEGASRKTKNERRRFFEISRSSLVETDAAIEIANDLGYGVNFNHEMLNFYLQSCFKILSSWLAKSP